MATFSHIIIWPFDEAPIELRLLYSGVECPRWLALVPASLYGADIDEIIAAQTGDGNASKYLTHTGDVVYTGFCVSVGLKKPIALFKTSGTS